MNVDDFATFSDSLELNVLEYNVDAIPEPDTLFIHMTRSNHEQSVTDGFRRRFSTIKRVVIDVDGEQHQFGADSLIRLREGYEGSSGGDGE